MSMDPADVDHETDNPDSPEKKDATDTQTSLDQNQKFHPLRVWIPILLILGMILARVIPSVINNGPTHLWMSPTFGPALCGILILLWWITLSRARWTERIVGFLGVIAIAASTIALVDQSMRGPAIPVLTIPIGMVAFSVGAILFGRLRSFRRTILMLFLACCGFGSSVLLRSDGFWGNYEIGLDWRWNPSAEDLMLAKLSEQPTVELAAISPVDFEAWLSDPKWPGYRGRDRSGRQWGTNLSTDWSANPPKEQWRIAVGPGWSSFAVAGNLLFTQEQRGKQETITCFMADSGSEVWATQIESRFDDPLGGPGPRATPTIANGALYVQGAHGQLMRIDPTNGMIAWQNDIKISSQQQNPPQWGFSSSPLVIDSAVIVQAGGEDEFGTLAFDTETGDLKWATSSGTHSYSSPHFANLLGEDVVMAVTNDGMKFLDPKTGEAKLNYQWKHNGYRSLQPVVVSNDSVLLPTGLGTGTRRIRIVAGQDGWSAEEMWTSLNMKPDFNDMVLYEGHAYGFDNRIFACIDLETGQRKWKGGRYGKGQILLLEDSGQILVASERGEVVLLKADPSEHVELGKFQAITGKTWNHPIVIGDRLYVRNSQEAACFELPTVK